MAAGKHNLLLLVGLLLCGGVAAEAEFAFATFNVAGAQQSAMEFKSERYEKMEAAVKEVATGINAQGIPQRKLTLKEFLTPTGLTACLPKEDNGLTVQELFAAAKGTPLRVFSGNGRNTKDYLKDVSVMYSSALLADIEKKTFPFYYKTGFWKKYVSKFPTTDNEHWTSKFEEDGVPRAQRFKNAMDNKYWTTNKVWEVPKDAKKIAEALKVDAGLFFAGDAKKIAEALEKDDAEALKESGAQPIAELAKLDGLAGKLFSWFKCGEGLVDCPLFCLTVAFDKILIDAAMLMAKKKTPVSSPAEFKENLRNGKDAWLENFFVTHPGGAVMLQEAKESWTNEDVKNLPDAFVVTAPDDVNKEVTAPKDVKNLIPKGGWFNKADGREWMTTQTEVYGQVKEINGVKVLLVSVHADSKFVSTLDALDEIDKQVRAAQLIIPGFEGNVIIGIDANCEGPNVQLFVKRYTDLEFESVRKGTADLPCTTQKERGWLQAQTDKVGKNDMSPKDFILYRGPDVGGAKEVTPLEGNRCPADPPLSAKNPSDHYPVVATFDVRECAGRKGSKPTDDVWCLCNSGGKKISAKAGHKAPQSACDGKKHQCSWNAEADACEQKEKITAPLSPSS